MKKKITTILLLLLFLFMVACDTENTPTVHAEKDAYTIGEEIVIRDDVSDEILGRVMITELLVIEEGPVYIDRKGNVRKNEWQGIDAVKCDAVIQMNYLAETLDSKSSISGDHFEIYEADGTLVRRNLNHRQVGDEKCVVFAVKKKEGGVTVDFRFHPDQEVITTITGGYGETAYGGDFYDDSEPEPEGKKHSGGVPSSESKTSIEEQYNRLKTFRTVLVIHIIVLVGMIVFLCFQQKRKKRREC